MKGVIGILPLLAIVVIGALVVIPGAWQSVYSSLTGASINCEVAPYSDSCSCAEVGQRKISVPWVGIPKWDCENIDKLLIDPESPTFEQDAISFAKNYFDYYCNDVCEDTECGDICQGTPITCGTNTDRYMTAVYGYSSEGERLVNIECNVITSRNQDGTQKSGYSPWRMNFLVESETEIATVYQVLEQSNYCSNSAETRICATPNICSQMGSDKCTGNLELNVISTPVASLFSGTQLPQLGSGFPSPV